MLHLDALRRQVDLHDDVAVVRLGADAVLGLHGDAVACRRRRRGQRAQGAEAVLGQLQLDDLRSRRSCWSPRLRRPVQGRGDGRAGEAELEGDLAVLECLEVVQAVDDLDWPRWPRAYSGGVMVMTGLSAASSTGTMPRTWWVSLCDAVGLDVIGEAAGQLVELEREGIGGVGGHALAADAALAVVEDQGGVPAGSVASPRSGRVWADRVNGRPTRGRGIAGGQRRRRTGGLRPGGLATAGRTAAVNSP